MPLFCAQLHVVLVSTNVCASAVIRSGRLERELLILLIELVLILEQFFEVLDETDDDYHRRTGHPDKKERHNNLCNQMNGNIHTARLYS
jgi:hypothetical protein